MAPGPSVGHRSSLNASAAHDATRLSAAKRATQVNEAVSQASWANNNARSPPRCACSEAWAWVNVDATTPATALITVLSITRGGLSASWSTCDTAFLRSSRKWSRNATVATSSASSSSFRSGSHRLTASPSRATQASRNRSRTTFSTRWVARRMASSSPSSAGPPACAAPSIALNLATCAAAVSRSSVATAASTPLAQSRSERTSVAAWMACASRSRRSSARRICAARAPARRAASSLRPHSASRRGAVRATLAAWNAIFSPVVVAICFVAGCSAHAWLVSNEICFCRALKFWPVSACSVSCGWLRNEE